MDANYNYSKAAKLLSEYTDERQNSSRSPLQLLKMFEDINSSNRYEASQIDKIGRLVHRQHGSDATEISEVVVAVQGILTGKELPPFKGRINVSKLGYYRQSVTIAIPSEAIVDKVLDQIGSIQGIFKRLYGDRHQDTCAFITCSGETTKSTTFDASNRLVKKRTEGDECQAIPLGLAVDPTGEIQAAANENGYVHTLDNEVQYFERKVDEKGDYQFASAEPTVFQVGDIVELQISFAALPIHQQKTRLSIILRSIGLIDSQLSKEIALNKFKAMTRATTSQRSIIKRSIGYSEENLSVIQSRMTIREDSKTIGQPSTAKLIEPDSDDEHEDQENRPEKRRC